MASADKKSDESLVSKLWQKAVTFAAACVYVSYLAGRHFFSSEQSSLSFRLGAGCVSLLTALIGYPLAVVVLIGAAVASVPALAVDAATSLGKWVRGKFSNWLKPTSAPQAHIHQAEPSAPIQLVLKEPDSTLQPAAESRPESKSTFGQSSPSGFKFWPAAGGNCPDVAVQAQASARMGRRKSS